MLRQLVLHNMYTSQVDFQRRNNLWGFTSQNNHMIMRMRDVVVKGSVNFDRSDNYRTAVKCIYIKVED